MNRSRAMCAGMSLVMLVNHHIQALSVLALPMLRLLSSKVQKRENL